jgi:hypothetical protein
MNIRTSTLDGKTLVVEIEDGDVGVAVDLMDTRENGFALFGEGVPVSMAAVDGRLFKNSWFTADHLLAIEAHELGHILTESIEEPVAEREGIRLLEAGGYITAAEILKERGIA